MESYNIMSSILTRFLLFSLSIISVFFFIQENVKGCNFLLEIIICEVAASAALAIVLALFLLNVETNRSIDVEIPICVIILLLTWFLCLILIPSVDTTKICAQRAVFNKFFLFSGSWVVAINFLLYISKLLSKEYFKWIFQYSSSPGNIYWVLLFLNFR